MAVSLVSTGVTFPDSSTQITAATGFGFKNRLINGSMVIDQRNAGASVSMSAGTNVFPVDRLQGAIAQGSGHTAQRSTSAPAGFINSVLVTIGTGASPTAGQIGRLYQPIEGLNITDLDWGLATASTITLSFWVKSSLTGTFAGGIYNNAANRTYVFTYAISAANTWEQKSITIAGDTSGTWLTTNGIGMIVNWDLGTGSTYQGTAGVWAAGAAWATSGSVKLAATSGATWYITGVQLEKGSTATSFDYKPYGTELALCQRYAVMLGNSGNAYSNYGYGAAYSTTAVSATVSLPVPMRAIPTTTFPGSGAFQFYRGATNYSSTSMDVGSPEATTTVGAYYFNSTGLTVDTFGKVQSANNTTTRILFSAEL